MRRSSLTTAVGKRKRTGLRLLLGGLIAVAILWCAYWLAASLVIRTAIDRSVASLVAAGGHATCNTGGMAGFPLSLEAACASLAFDDQRGRSVELADIRATVPLYRPGAAAVSMTGPLLVSLPREPEPIKATWSDASARLRIWLSGLSSVAAAVDALHIEAIGLPPLTLGAVEVSALPSGGDYRLQLAVSDGKVEMANGAGELNLAVTADLTAVELGSALGSDPVKLLLDWLRSGGTVKIARVAITADRTKAAATGDLALSSDGLLSGTLVVTLSGLDTLPETAETVLTGTRDQIEHSIGVIKTFARKVENGDTASYELSLRIRSGRVALGLIPIARIPALLF